MVSGRNGVRSWRHAVALAWFALLALLVLAPALRHGSGFGSYDLLDQFGVLRRHGIVVHNIQAGDQSDSIIPWAALSWTQVHHGHLPLWNPYSALGMPLAFNWQAASFSVPALIGYLFPYGLSFTVQVVVTLIIAGSGVYALGRVLGWTTLSCLFAGSVFELSGPMLGWLGWPHAAVMSWAGWLFAAAFLILQGRAGVRAITALALVVAAMVYAGQPEILTLFLASLAIVAVVVLASRLPALGGEGPVRRPFAGLAIGTVAGAALGAPLLLPGLQVVSGSQHGAAGGDPAELVKGNPPLPVHNLLHLALQGYDGLPIAGNHWFGYVGGYSETAAYIGVIPLVLVVLALARGRRRPAVIAFAALALVTVAVAFVPAVVDALNHLPVVKTLVWQRAILPLVLALTVLSGFGMEALVRHPDRASVRRWLTGGFGGAGVVVVVLWLVGRRRLALSDASARQGSLLWAAVEIMVGLLVVGALAWAARARRTTGSDPPWWRRGLHRWPGSTLLVGEAVFLLAAGGSLWSATSAPFTSTPSVAAFQRAVGSATVGYGAPLCFFPPGLGIPVNAQIAYGVQELAAYDPALPSSYFSSWTKLTGRAAGLPAISAYCPVVTTVAEAQLYGVGFVLERAGSPGPKGAPLATTVGDEDLYRIPGAAAATLTPRAESTRPPGSGATSTPVTVAHPDPATWTMITTAPDPEVLRLRLTDLPGWHATVDGHPVPLTRFAGVMLQANLPPGRHQVRLYYWPAAFTQGIVLAAVAAVGLLCGLVAERTRRRGRRSVDAEAGPDAPTS